MRMVFSGHMRLTLIAAASENNVIGKDNAIPWTLPEDFKHMRSLTDGKPLIMGRKTHESIGRPLPNRLNIVVTHDAGREFPGCVAVTSLEEGIAKAEQSGAGEAFIFGGERLYRDALPVADRIELTRVHAQVEGDAFFPAIPDGWEVIREERHEADDKHRYPFTFLTYERR